MKKLDLYNQLKQEQYKADIEALRWAIWALEADNEADRAEYQKIAEREESEAMGIFKAKQSILGDYQGKMNAKTEKLFDAYIEKFNQHRELREEVAK